MGNVIGDEERYRGWGEWDCTIGWRGLGRIGVGIGVGIGVFSELNSICISPHASPPASPPASPH